SFLPFLKDEEHCSRDQNRVKSRIVSPDFLAFRYVPFLLQEAVRMDLTTLTSINTLVIVAVLAVAVVVLYAVRKDQIRLDEQNNIIALQTAATREVAREIIR